MWKIRCNEEMDMVVSKYLIQIQNPSSLNLFGMVNNRRITLPRPCCLFPCVLNYFWLLIAVGIFCCCYLWGFCRANSPKQWLKLSVCFTEICGFLILKSCWAKNASDVHFSHFQCYFLIHVKMSLKRKKKYL